MTRTIWPLRCDGNLAPRQASQPGRGSRAALSWTQTKPPCGGGLRWRGRSSRPAVTPAAGTMTGRVDPGRGWTLPACCAGDTERQDRTMLGSLRAEQMIVVYYLHWSLEVTLYETTAGSDSTVSRIGQSAGEAPMVPAAYSLIAGWYPNAGHRLPSAPPPSRCPSTRGLSSRMRTQANGEHPPLGKAFVTTNPAPCSPRVASVEA